MKDLNIEAALRAALYLAVDGRDFTLARIYLDCLGRRADHIQALTAGENAAERAARLQLPKRLVGPAPRPKCPEHGQPMVPGLTDRDTGEQLWHCACTYDANLKVWKEALDGADTQIQQAVTETPCATGFITLVGEQPRDQDAEDAAAFDRGFMKEHRRAASAVHDDL